MSNAIVAEVGLNHLPYGVPLHPGLVHFTVGLFVIAIGADLVGILYDRRAKLTADSRISAQSNCFEVGWWNLLAATVITSVTIAVGIYEAALAQPPSNLTTSWGLSAGLTMYLHGIGGILLLIGMLLLCIWRGFQRYRWRKKHTQQVTWQYALAGIIVTGLMTVQGTIGAQLAHDVGIHNTAAIVLRSSLSTTLAPVQLKPSVRDPLAPHPPSLAKPRTVLESMVYPPLNLPDPTFTQIEQTLYYGIKPVLRLSDSVDWAALLTRLNERSWRADQFGLSIAEDHVTITLAGKPLLQVDPASVAAKLSRLQQAVL